MSIIDTVYIIHVSTIDNASLLSLSRHARKPAAVISSLHSSKESLIINILVGILQSKILTMYLSGKSAGAL